MQGFNWEDDSFPQEAYFSLSHPVGCQPLKLIFTQILKQSILIPLTNPLC